MKLFPAEKQIDLYKTSFDGDVLEREKFANQLSELIGKASEPLVIALDGKWGSGKSYFLKRWVGHHPSDKGTTVYFDAFEHDYLSEPLISIITAVNNRIPKDHKKNWKELGFKIAKPAAAIALNVATLGAKEQAGDLLGSVVEAVSGEAKKASEKFWAEQEAKAQSMQDFKGLLRKIATDGKPLIIVVDELDRCRPDYALSVLEIVKHFFNVKNVHFVLGVNLRALENSVEARYGTGIDANNYLKKFIHIKASFPDKLGERGEIDPLEEYFKTRSKEMELDENFIDHCKKAVICASRKNNVSLRDIEKICSKIALTPRLKDNGTWESGWVSCASILIVASVVSEMFHARLIDQTATQSEIFEFLGIDEGYRFFEENGQRNQKYSEGNTEYYYSLLCHGQFGEGCAELEICNKRFREPPFDIYPLGFHEWMLTIQKDFVDVFKAI